MKKKYLLRLHGFSVVELIIVIAMAGVLGIVFTTIMIQSMRGQNKVNAIDQVKQNGQLVMNELSNEIRMADQVVCTTTTGPQTLVVLENGLYYRYTLVSPSGGANGYIKKEISPTVDSGTNPPLSAGTTKDQVCATVFSSAATSLTLSDTNTQTGVSINAPAAPDTVFTENTAGGYDTVTIKFVISPAVSVSSLEENRVSPETFTTTVELQGMQR